MSRKPLNPQIPMKDALEVFGLVAELIKERNEAQAEATKLRWWKAEVTEELKRWHEIHKILGEPGMVGESIVETCIAQVRRLVDRRDRRMEICCAQVGLDSCWLVKGHPGDHETRSCEPRREPRVRGPWPS